jgi:hypothetical protein
MMAPFDEYQSKENGKHTLRAMKENARQGFWTGPAAAATVATICALAQRVEVADGEVRIMGSKGDLLRTLAPAAGVKSAALGVPSSVPKWRPRRDSNPRPQDSYHFDFRRRPLAFVVRTVPSP